MKLDFSTIKVGAAWTRPALATLWKYKGYQAFAKGAFCPRSDNKIILFVTRDKQEGATPYKDFLHDNVLQWEGPKDHGVDFRIVSAGDNGDCIHVFYRSRHHKPFTYLGLATLYDYELRTSEPSSFRFRLVSESSPSSIRISL